MELKVCRPNSYCREERQEVKNDEATENRNCDGGKKDPGDRSGCAEGLRA